ncbi:DUF4129 domain-containing protein [Halorarum salinum]|uniref:DUF4129 domain-containing protein n=1 Tax=Halorarum salinum TaxID=2743089 RepID=A0A7D5Q9V9_9EURY|nr:DUF4129 domain-containing protein [Halobaculum salinum]QLG60380.1 DUF4129 domain-containing protein [Halobaculum salinum]
MTGEQALSAALALCCLFALGTSAATLDASVDTTPDDVIELDMDSIPLPSDEVGSLKEQLQSEPGEGDRQSAEGDSDPSAGEPSDGSEQSGEASERSDETSGGSADDGSQESGSDAESEDRSAPTAEGDEEPGPVTESNLFDRLLALLRALLGLLSSLLPVLLLLGVVAAAVRHPRRLEALFAAVLERFGPARNGGASGPGAPLVSSPSNDVARTWCEMARRLDLDDDLAATPGDVAAAAVQAGVDPEVARQVTEPFEEVTYGDAPVTEGRLARAREGIERFRAQYRGEGGE